MGAGFRAGVPGWLPEPLAARGAVLSLGEDVHEHNPVVRHRYVSSAHS